MLDAFKCILLFKRIEGCVGGNIFLQYATGVGYWLIIISLIIDLFI